MSNIPKVTCKWVEDISEFNESFIESWNEESDEVYFIGVDVRYRKNFDNLHNDLLFLTEKLKIEKLKNFCMINLQDKEKYVIHIRNLKQASSHVNSFEKSSLSLIKKLG